MSDLWSAVLTSGVGFIDDDHKDMLHWLGAIDGERLRREPYLYAEAVERFTAHFRREENEMRRTRYPHAAQHEAEHRHFEAQLAALMATMRVPGFARHDAVLNFLSSWMVGHVLGADRRFGRSLADDGVPALACAAA